MAQNPDKIPVLYVVRHGTTVLNEQHKFRGPANPPLDKQGFKDANVLAYFFEPLEVGLIVSSDKLRSVQTSDIIGRKKGITPIYTEQLHALDVGELSGKERNPETENIVHYYTVLYPDIPFPGGETLNDFRRRVDPVILEGIEHGLATGIPDIISGHSSIVHELGVLLHQDHTRTLVQPGGVAMVYLANGKLQADPIFKPDLERISKREEVFT
jgi:broad specificity phosphatase PhoE